ncbi:hypothetical protein ADK38_45000 [Streptomyces varsoviensis]|uniref:MFS transporter n=1 Tax=Streptomyces varsoviensis TaxID=67373 RepID=A0ABR5IS15_9ACTN|nr:hypothetical protein ADK38_45000 [Streptomyces varsoviensis]
MLASGVGGGHYSLGGFTDASRPAWWIITGCGTAVLLLGAVTTGRWAKGTARHAAVLFEESPGPRTSASS